MYFPEGIPDAIDSAVKGDFKDDDGSYSDRFGKIIGGLNPAGDVRDIVADGRRVADGEKGSWIKLGATVIGAVPIAGDGAKALIKTEEKAIIEGLENTGKKAIVEETTEGLIKTESKKVGEETVEKFVAEDANKVLTETTGRTTIKETSEKVALTASGNKAVKQDTLEHIFHGEVNGRGRATGFHYEGVDNMQVVKKTRVIESTRSIPDGNGIYTANIEVNGIRKNQPSSFFPKAWSKNDVVNSINEAYINKIHPRPSNPLYFEDRSSNGFLIGGYLK